MAYQPIMNAFRLSAEEAGGQPSYFDSIMKGFQGAQTAAETAYKPKKLHEELLDSMLKNKINQAKADYAQQNEAANLAHTQAGTGLIGQQSKYYGRNAESEIALRDAQRGLYGAQAQKAAQEAGLKKRLMEAYFPQGNTQYSEEGQPQSSSPQEQGPSFSQGNQMRLPDESAQSSNGQEIPPYARKILGLPAEFPHEKMQREINTSFTKEQNKADIKRTQQLRESAKDLELAGMDLDGIHDLLSGPEYLGTGITKTLAGKLGWGSEKLGAFNERALRLQSQMARALSQRGGVGAAKIVAGGKPSSWKSTRENLGITDAYADRVYNEFKLLNKEYKNITGKPLPYSLPEYVNNIGTKINKDSFSPKTTFADENEYHSYMSSLKPEQRAIALKAIRSASK